MELTPRENTSLFVIPAIAKLSLGNVDAFCPVLLQLFLSLLAQGIWVIFLTRDWHQ